METGEQSPSKQMDSNASRTSSSSKKNLRRPPNCQLCSNHKRKIPLKGHKRYCENRNCRCILCQKSRLRQNRMAQQTAARRAKNLDQQRGITLAEGESFNGDGDQSDSTSKSSRKLEISYDTNSADSPLSIQYKNEMSPDFGPACGSPKARKSRSFLPSARTSTPLPPSQPGGEFVEALLHCSTILMEILQYSYTALPLMYVILKYAGANMEEATKRIEEARMEICMIDYVRRYRMSEYARQYCCLGYSLSPGTIEGVPTYDRSAPYVGVVPPQCNFHLPPRPDSMTPYATEPSSIPVSSPEEANTDNLPGDFGVIKGVIKGVSQSLHGCTVL